VNDVSTGTESKQWELEAIYFTNVSPSAANPIRESDWSIQVTQPATPPTGSFKAYNAAAVAGWQIVGAPRAFNG
jgi:hypothetical protein